MCLFDDTWRHSLTSHFGCRDAKGRNLVPCYYSLGAWRAARARRVDRACLSRRSPSARARGQRARPRDKHTGCREWMRVSCALTSVERQRERDRRSRRGIKITCAVAHTVLRTCDCAFCILISTDNYRMKTRAALKACLCLPRNGTLQYKTRPPLPHSPSLPAGPLPLFSMSPFPPLSGRGTLPSRPP